MLTYWNLHVLYADRIPLNEFIPFLAEIIRPERKGRMIQFEIQSQDYLGLTFYDAFFLLS